MNITVNNPGKMTVSPKHVSGEGQTMVHVAEDRDDRAVLLWVKPETAAQWIKALTPLAAQATA